MITLVCEIFEVEKVSIVLSVFFAADFENAISFALSGLVFSQMHILFFTNFFNFLKIIEKIFCVSFCVTSLSQL